MPVAWYNTVTGGGMLAFQNKMIHIQGLWRGKTNNHLHHTTHGVHVFLWVVPHQRGQSQTSHLPAMIKIACQQALCLGKGWKNHEEGGRKGWEPADHLSAKSLSVTWIHWNVINFAWQKGSVGNTQLLPCAKMLLFPMTFFSQWWVDCALEGLVFSFNWENVIFGTYFILRGRDTHIDSLRLLYLVIVICPLMQEHSLQLKKLISQVPEDAMLKITRSVYKQLFKSNCMLRADWKSDVNQTRQQSVFSPIGASIRIWCTVGAVERWSQFFGYRLSPFPFPLLAMFSPFPQTEKREEYLL